MAFCCAARQRRTAAACRRCYRAPDCPISRRNKEVERHLGLAHLAAERYIRASGCRGGAEPEDIHAAACAGMVRCMERFDASKGHRLSTYAMPFIGGAIRQHLRDNWMPVKAPRRLLELQQRSRRYRHRRHRQGLPPLPIEQLAAELGTSVKQLQEAELAWYVGQRVYSLDAMAQNKAEADPEDP